MFQLSQHAVSRTRTRSLTHCLQLRCSSRSGLAGDFPGIEGGVPVAEDHLGTSEVSRGAALRYATRRVRIAAMVGLSAWPVFEPPRFLVPLW